MNRRAFLLASPLLTSIAEGQEEPLPPVRAITRSPGFHWFGYYDKLQLDPSSRFALGCRGRFEHRLPKADDVLELGMVDTEDDDRWIELADTRAWSWHQTCMIQWLPGSNREIIFNDRDGGRFVSYILDVKTKKRRQLPSPIYCVSPDARWALATDFRRLGDVRPETGYAGVPDPNRDSAAPSNAGVWRIDLRTGRTELLISYAEIVRIPNAHTDMTGAKHWFNHLLINPQGDRFVFLHRWRKAEQGRAFSTRMFTASATGRDVRLLDPYGRTSHFIWRDSKTLLAWSAQPVLSTSRADVRLSSGLKEGWYLFEDSKTARVEPFAQNVLTRNGHCTFVRGRWLLTDTAPDENRLQHPYLFDISKGTIHPLGHFHSPPEYTGYWRCDTTPRCSPGGTKVVVDSPHGGNGRQMYLIDIRGIVGQ
jgi:hypothetical protein